MPTLASRSAARSRAPRSRRRARAPRTTSAICAPMVWTGENELIGSWKIMPMRAAADRLDRLAARAERGDVGAKAVAGVQQDPAARRSTGPALRSCISDSAVTLLPEPLSPTSASTSPLPIEKETSSSMRNRVAVLPRARSRGCATLEHRRSGAAVITTSNRDRRRRAGRRRRKLKASTATMTKTPGIISQGAWSMARMLCAAKSSTPQLSTGSRSPRPRKESEVSASRISGKAIEVSTIR